MVLAIVVFVVSLFFVIRKVKDEKKQRLAGLIVASLELVFVLITRFGDTIWDVNNIEGATWWWLIPHSLCSFCSLVISLTYILGKKDNPIIYALFICGFLGGLSNIFYPDFLNDQPISEIRTFAALLHHLSMAWLTFYLAATGYFKVSMRKLHYFPIAYAIMVMLAVFEIQVLHFNDSMNVAKPLLKDLPVLTSWYVLGIAMFGANIIFTVLYNKFHDKMSFKDIFTFKKVD